MNQRQRRATGRDVALPVGGRAVEVLGFLRRGMGKYVSGAEVSRALRISRTAVWKHIGTLRDAGYVIEAHPSRGYRLLEVPDLLIPAELQRELKTRFVGKRIHHLISTDSTNRAAHDLAAQGAPEGTAVIAEEQTRGRGRLGRGWFSPPRLNIYLSIILRPSIALSSVPQLTLVGAVATVRAISAVYEGPPELRPRIKWPNDILIGSRKVSGTLVETTTVGETLQHVILGVGINVNLREKDLPRDLSETATSLRIASGHTLSRRALCRKLFLEFEACYERFLREGFGKLSEEYAEMSDLWGRRVRVSLAEGAVEGVAEGLDPDGALRLRTADGPVRRILAGDVHLLR
jgi:BirA family biotin operon repressor/biotin-[acetyl-CoA-carboxylase] ligase